MAIPALAPVDISPEMVLSETGEAVGEEVADVEDRATALVGDEVTAIRVLGNDTECGIMLAGSVVLPPEARTTVEAGPGALEAATRGVVIAEVRESVAVGAGAGAAGVAGAAGSMVLMPPIGPSNVADIVVKTFCVTVFTWGAGLAKGLAKGAARAEAMATGFGRAKALRAAR
jgi:hypothetical protein